MVCNVFQWETVYYINAYYLKEMSFFFFWIPFSWYLSCCSCVLAASLPPAWRPPLSCLWCFSPLKDAYRELPRGVCVLSQAKWYCLFAPCSSKSIFLETTLPLLSYGCELLAHGSPDTSSQALVPAWQRRTVHHWKFSILEQTSLGF